MTFTASLPQSQRDQAIAAFAAFGRLLSEALDDQAETARVHGPRAVAQAAYVPGGPPVEEIEARYLQLAAQSRGSAAPAGKAA